MVAVETAVVRISVLFCVRSFTEQQHESRLLRPWFHKLLLATLTALAVG